MFNNSHNGSSNTNSLSLPSMSDSNNPLQQQQQQQQLQQEQQASSSYFKPTGSKPFNVHPVSYLNADSTPSLNRKASSNGQKTRLDTTSTATESTGSPLGSTTSSYTEASSAPESPPSLQVADSPNIKLDNIKLENVVSTGNQVNSNSIPSLGSSNRYLGGLNFNNTSSSSNNNQPTNTTLLPSLESSFQQPSAIHLSLYKNQATTPSIQQRYQVPPLPSLSQLGADPFHLSSADDQQKIQSQPKRSYNTKDDGDSPLECKWRGCSVVFDDAKTLYQHLCDFHVGRKCNRNLSLACQWGNCQVVTVKRDHITSHLRVHVPLKPFACETCDKKFKRPQDLKKHVKTHAEDSKKNKARKEKELRHQQQQQFGQRSDFGYPSFDFNPLPHPNRYNTGSGNFELPLPFSLPHPNAAAQDRKRTFDYANPNKLPSFYEDLKRSKIQPTYGAELASKLNSLDNNLGIAHNISSETLPPLGNNAKFGGFNNQQDLLDASTFFNQISNSMNLDQQHSQQKSVNSNNSNMPSVPSLASNNSLYPIFPSPNLNNNSIKNNQSSSGLPTGTSYYPQLNSRTSSDANDFIKKLNIGSNQKTSSDELAKRLASINISDSADVVSDSDDDDKDYTSYYDQSDSEYEDMESEYQISEFSEHKTLINGINEYLNSIVANANVERNDNVPKDQVHGAASSARLYPVIQV